MVAAIIVGMGNHVGPVRVIVEPFAVVNVHMDRSTHVDTGRFNLFDDGGGREDGLGVDAVSMETLDSGGADLTTNARTITEGARSITFDAETCPDDTVDDLGGSLTIEDILCVLIDDEDREICWRNKGFGDHGGLSPDGFSIEDSDVSRTSSAVVISTVQRDIPVLDSIVDESRGSDGLEGLDPEDGSLDIVEEDGDVGWDRLVEAMHLAFTQDNVGSHHDSRLVG
ncbi:hypothetical protein F5887DRAFT_1087440 [Amanita rubescens]|nr:hypothetical protein F5887DRAFT_1087440 [Amanita rubescens]